MWVFRFLAALLTLCFSITANSQDWPTKVVKFVSPYPPGGSVDPLARLLAAKLTDSLRQQFIVENRTGASGIIGTDYVAKSAPDGYTWVFIFDTHAVHQALNPKLPFDPIKRSEERRVGKECRSRSWQYHYKKKTNDRVTLLHKSTTKFNQYNIYTRAVDND